jgi:SRSO17 transposase
MEATEIAAMGKRLDEYMGGFSDCFARGEPAEHARTYVKGQFSTLPRKSIEPIADQAGIDPRALQLFLSQHKWDEQLMVKRVHETVARNHAHPHSVGIVDETSFPKKGVKTPGVQRQHCGAVGKQDNCTITVHLGYATPDFHCLLSSALFLPESWANDLSRRREAKIPEELEHRPKWKIALELHQQAKDYGIPFEWLTADEHYGRPVEFHLEMSRREQRYVVEVPLNFYCWCRKPEIAQGSRGPYRKRTPPISTVEHLAKFSKQFADEPWEGFHIKDSRKGPVIWEAKAAPIYLKDSNDLPTGRHWLVVARNALNREEIKYFVSNAPAGTPLEVLLYVGFSRSHVERCFEDQKTELGMDHFEVRNYCSLMRHLILTSVSYLFVAQVHQQLKKNSGVNGLSGTHSGQCVFECSRQAGSEPPQFSTASIGSDLRNTTPQCCRSVLSSKEDESDIKKTWNSNIEVPILQA